MGRRKTGGDTRHCWRTGSRRQEQERTPVLVEGQEIRRRRTGKATCPCWSVSQDVTAGCHPGTFWSFGPWGEGELDTTTDYFFVLFTWSILGHLVILRSSVSLVRSCYQQFKKKSSTWWTPPSRTQRRLHQSNLNHKEISLAPPSSLFSCVGACRPTDLPCKWETSCHTFISAIIALHRKHLRDHHVHSNQVQIKTLGNIQHSKFI